MGFWNSGSLTCKNFRSNFLIELPKGKGKGKGTGKIHPRTGHEGPKGEQMYSYTLPSTLVRDGGVGGQRHVPAALPPGKARYLLYRRLGGLQGRSARVREISPTTGIISPDCRYTVCAIAAPNFQRVKFLSLLEINQGQHIEL
jgi:hypothetical protein